MSGTLKAPGRSAGAMRQGASARGAFASRRRRGPSMRRCSRSGLLSAGATTEAAAASISTAPPPARAALRVQPQRRQLD